MSSALLGKNRVSEAEVFSVPAIPWTKTHHPVHHKSIITAVKDAIHSAGMLITKQEYVLAGNNGEKVFGVYDLNQGCSELCWSVGVRNSMDKSFALSFTCGTRVFVCENLCFSGDHITISRRHTSRLDVDEIAFLAFRAIRKMVPQLKRFQAWHQGLRNYPLADVDMKILLVEIMANSVIPASKFHQFNELFAKVYDDSLWGFHEAATDVLKGSNLMTQPQKNKLLNDVLNSYIDSLDSAVNYSVGDFFERRAMRQ